MQSTTTKMNTYKVIINQILFLEGNKPVFPKNKNEHILIIKSEKLFDQFDIVKEVNLQFPEEQLLEKGSVLYKREYVEPSKFYPEGYRHESIIFSEKYKIEYPDQTDFDLFIQMDLKEEEIIKMACLEYKNAYKASIVEWLKEKINSQNPWMIPPACSLKLSATFSSSQYDDLQPLEIRTIWSHAMYSSVYQFYRDEEGFLFSIFIGEKSTPSTQNNKVMLYRLSTDIKGRFDESNELHEYLQDRIFEDDPQVHALRKELYEVHKDTMEFPNLPELPILLPSS